VIVGECTSRGVAVAHRAAARSSLPGRDGSGAVAAASARGPGGDRGAANTAPASGDCGDGGSDDRDGRSEPAGAAHDGFVVLELRYGRGQPMAGERYRVTTPGGEVREGRLDGRGLARVEGLPAGDCKIAFPDRAGQDWN
jgi:hypothetical protein